VTIAEYLTRIKQHLLTNTVVLDFSVIRERATTTDGYLRAKLTFVDHSWLEFSEYVQRSGAGQINVVTYSYHWADAEARLILRWDNTPHFLELPGAPHHIHQGSETTVSPGQPVDIFIVLDEIIRQLQSDH